jgi:hypothetical protein
MRATSNEILPKRSGFPYSPARRRPTSLYIHSTMFLDYTVPAIIALVCAKLLLFARLCNAAFQPTTITLESSI